MPELLRPEVRRAADAEPAEPAEGVEGVEPGARIEPGTRVEVRQRFDLGWARGFEVADVIPDGYRVRRLSDGSIIPTDFAEDDVRVERRRKQGLWWY